MKELKCPNCGNIFTVDSGMFESIASQVRNKAFEEELQKREDELRRQLGAVREADELRLRSAHEAELSALREKVNSDLLKTRQKSEIEVIRLQKEVEELKNRLKTAESNTGVMVENALLKQQSRSESELKKRDETIAELRVKVDSVRQEGDLRIASLKEQHAALIKEKDETIEYYKDFKARLSTKMIGESLESHCRSEFERVRSLGMFPEAFFDKDNDASGGSKGDFIFRDFYNGTEYISIMFEMKNESDVTPGSMRHRNSDFLEKLDRDRRNKNCEYAVLVTLLERDNDLYNEGIVNVSYLYPKMFVIRPQHFLNLISILTMTSRKSLMEISSLREQLAIAQAQTLDVTNFERRRDKFVAEFGKLVEAHTKKHNEAIAGIDKVIETLEKQADALKKVKSLFETSEQKLLNANDRAGTDFTIRKLTHGNKTMKRLFDEAGKSGDESEEL